MSALRFIKHVYFSYLSRPPADRQLYRALAKQPPRSVLMLGLGDTRRADRLLRHLLERVPAEELKFTGVDLFEMRAANGGERLPLKQVHAQFKPLGMKVQLVPGDVFSALSRMANSLTNTDWILIAADTDAESLRQAWFYFPRMLSPQSVVFREEATDKPGITRFREISFAEIETLASVVAAQRNQRRAA